MKASSHGTLEVLVNVRVSDSLRQQPGLAVLPDCISRVTGVAEWLNQQV